LKKKILFFTHSNNDLDHFLPIVEKNNKYENQILFCPDGNTSEINNLHKKFILKRQTQIFEFINLLDNFILKIIYSFYQKLKFFKINYQKNFFSSKTLSILTFFLDKILTKLIPKKTLKKNVLSFLNNNEIELIVTDIQNQNKRDFSNFYRKSFNIFLHAVQKLKLPLFMITHGANIVFHDKKKGVSYDENIFQSDSLAICNNFETFLYKNLAKKKDYIRNLGDVRFDLSWIDYLKKINLNEINTMMKKNSNLKILYVLGNMSFLNKSVEQKINKEIIGLLNDFENIEIWVKIHPRTNINFNFKHKNLKVFYQDCDTSILVQASDVVITTLSGVLTEAILSDKFSILYDSWKQYLSNPWTIFDETPCVKKAQNYEQLKNLIKFYNKDYKSSLREKNDYFTKFISGGKKINQSIVQDYLFEIDKLLKKAN